MNKVTLSVEHGIVDAALAAGVCFYLGVGGLLLSLDPYPCADGRVLLSLRGARFSPPLLPLQLPAEGGLGATLLQADPAFRSNGRTNTCWKFSLCNREVKKMRAVNRGWWVRASPNGGMGCMSRRIDRRIRTGNGKIFAVTLSKVKRSED